MKKKILILGAAGMIGNGLVKYFSKKRNILTFASVKSLSIPNNLKRINNLEFITGISAENLDSLVKLFDLTSPNVVVNCIGVIKQKKKLYNRHNTIYLNSFFPHYLAKLSNKYHFRLIHISTDCIFSGLKGNYAENDTPDATDLYGKTKLLGEINYKNAVTIRTSVIGHEVSTTQGLLDWFLSQSGVVKGFEKAIFSGLTNIELAKIIYKTIIPNYNLKGIYHISGETISKYRLLLIIKKIYNMKNIVIISEKKKKINRSLNSNYFKNETGYKSPAWLKMIKEMHKYYYDFKN